MPPKTQIFFFSPPVFSQSHVNFTIPEYKFLHNLHVFATESQLKTSHNKQTHQALANVLEIRITNLPREAVIAKAGDGDRTHLAGLEGRCISTMLRPQKKKTIIFFQI